MNQELQKQLQEGFKMSNSTRIKIAENKKVLHKLDKNLIQLNHNMGQLEFFFERLIIDKKFYIIHITGERLNIYITNWY